MMQVPRVWKEEAPCFQPADPDGATLQGESSHSGWALPLAKKTVAGVLPHED